MAEEEVDQKRIESAEEAVSANNDALAKEVANEQLDRVQSEGSPELDGGEIATQIYSDIPGRLRWSEQCFLASNVGEIAKWQRDNYKREYYYIDTAVGPPSQFMNKIFDKPGSGEFVNMGPGDVSELIPMFDLYKPLYKHNMDNEGRTNWEFQGEVPLSFEKMAREDILKARTGEAPSSERSLDTLFVDPQKLMDDDLASSLADSARLPQPEGFSYGNDNDIPPVGYGWTSFEWSFRGANPAEVRNDITATLVLEFQNFDQLSQVRSAKVSNPKDVGDTYATYSLLDLLGWGYEAMETFQETKNDSEKRDLATDQYHQKRYEIKAVVGWHVPENWKETNDDGSNIGGLFGSAAAETLDSAATWLQDTAGGEDLFEDPAARKKKYAEALEGQKHVLYLTAVDHKFNILDIGRFTLTINYRARLEGILTQPLVDVIMTPETRREVSELSREIEIAKSDCNGERVADLKEKYDKEIDSFRTVDFQSFITHLSKEDKTENKESEQRVNDMEPANKPSNYLENSIPALEENSSRSRVYSLKVDKDQIVQFAAGEDDDLELGGYEDINESDPLEQLAIASPTSAGKDEIFSQTQPFTSTSGDKLKALQEVSPSITDGSVTIQFVYLGDLIEFAAHKALNQANFTGDELTAISSDQADRIKILLGPYEFINNDGDKEHINLVDIPISVRSFTDWWYKNVIARNRESYPLMLFVRDLIDQLVVEAMGARCGVDTGKPKDSKVARVRTSSITLPAKNDGDPLKQLESWAYNDNGDIWSQLINIKSTTGETLNGIYDSSLAEEQNVEEQYHYMVVFVESTTPHDLKGVEEDDKLVGIHHLKLHQGILKSIAFEKTDIPAYREARMEEQINSRQWNPYIQLTNVYNVSFETVGNTLFFPGTYVYINPMGPGTFGSSIGLPNHGPTDENGNSQMPSLSNIMGLGGYHMIINSTNTINAAGFSTRVNAVYDNSGGPGGKRIPTVIDPDSC